MKELGEVLGVAVIFVYALAWLTRKLLTHWMDKEVDKHRAALQAENAAATERLRSELRRQSLEHEVKYRRNDDRIAERLDQVYRRLLRFYECIVSYVKAVEHSDEPPKDAKLHETRSASKRFWDYFISRGLYIPPALFKATKAFADKLTSITNDFTENLRRETHGMEPDDIHFWSKTFSEINKEQASVFSSLVEEFQRRLGVFDPVLVGPTVPTGPEGTA